jgi:hypothetical protein
MGAKNMLHARAREQATGTALKGCLPNCRDPKRLAG